MVRVLYTESTIEHGALTLNEFRDEIGREPYAGDWADKPMIKVGYEFVEDLGTTDLLSENQAPNA